MGGGGEGAGADGGGAIGHLTGIGPVSHGRSHRSSAVESGHGNSVANVPATLVSAMAYPVSDTSQLDPTVASNGEVEPDVPTADKVIELMFDDPSQVMLTSAVTLVSTAGAAT